MVCNERNLRERRKIFVCELKRCSLGGSLCLQVEGIFQEEEEFVQQVLEKKKFHETEVLPHISTKRGRVYGNVEISATTAYHVL